MSSILVNNVGANQRRPIAMESFEQFWSGVEINLKSVGLFGREQEFKVHLASLHH